MNERNGRIAATLVVILSAFLAWSVPIYASEKVLKVRFGSDVSGIDPVTVFQAENQSIAAHVYNGLVRYNDKTNLIEPDLASSWRVSGDGKIFTFQLRKGVQFHKDFGEFTAEDVKYSYERVMEAKTKSRYRGEFSSVKSIDVLGPYEVRITLNKAFNFLHKVALDQGYIVSRRAVEKFGSSFPVNPVGTGPFVWDKWIRGSEIHLVANNTYFEGRPHADRVIFKIIPEETAAEIALANREIDIFWLLQSAEVINRLKKDRRVAVFSRSSNQTMNLVMNTTYGPLAKKEVRQAIAYGFNRRALVENYFLGLQNPANGAVLTVNFPEFSSNVMQYTYDPERAKRLLAEAGYPNGFSLEIGGISLYPFDEIPVILAEDLKKIGIKATVRIYERATYAQARAKGDLQTCITGIPGPADPDRPLWLLYHTNSFPPGLNTARYDKVDALLEAAQVEQDEAKRRLLYEKVQQQVMEDMPVLPMYEVIRHLAANKYVKGIVTNSIGTVPNLRRVSLEQ